MTHADEMRRCLDQQDLVGIIRLWAHVCPHLPAPATQHDARITMHIARTQTDVLAFSLRAYSHAWLTERSLPSMLPDHLKPSAERLYPRVVTAVGISVNARDPAMKPAAKAIERAMSNAVEEAYADGRSDPAFVHSRMSEARLRERRRLFGSMR